MLSCVRVAVSLGRSESAPRQEPRCRDGRHAVAAVTPACLLGGGIQLPAQAVGHRGRRRARQAEVDLDRVVDEPLERGQRADHDDPRHETPPHRWTRQYTQ